MVRVCGWLLGPCPNNLMSFLWTPMSCVGVVIRSLPLSTSSTTKGWKKSLNYVTKGDWGAVYKLTTTTTGVFCLYIEHEIWIDQS